MICAPIDTDGPRFRVITVEGYPISAGEHGGTPVLVATVLDGFYFTEHGRFASNDTPERRRRPRSGEAAYGVVCGCGKPKARDAHECAACRRPGSLRYVGREGALAAAEARCAELNAWHEREGWGE